LSTLNAAFATDFTLNGFSSCNSNKELNNLKVLAMILFSIHPKINNPSLKREGYVIF
jgi:hypothetical protein